MDQGAAATIADPANTIVVSISSVGEIAVKRRAGKLRFDGSPVDEVAAAGLQFLSITGRHAEAGRRPPPAPPGLR